MKKIFKYKGQIYKKSIDFRTESYQGSNFASSKMQLWRELKQSTPQERKQYWRARKFIEGLIKDNGLDTEFYRKNSNHLHDTLEEKTGHSDIYYELVLYPKNKNAYCYSKYLQEPYQYKEVE